MVKIGDKFKKIDGLSTNVCFFEKNGKSYPQLSTKNFVYNYLDFAFFVLTNVAEADVDVQNCILKSAFLFLLPREFLIFHKAFVHGENVAIRAFAFFKSLRDVGGKFFLGNGEKFHRHVTHVLDLLQIL